MSTISKKQFKQYIEGFEFTGLFNHLGWTYLDEQTPVKLKEETYLFHSVAEKSGFRIMVLKPAKHQDLPDYATRLQLDRKIGKLFREHLIIFCDKNNSTQIWQLFVKQLGKPSRLSETRWHKGQEPELLYQKTSNLFFTLDQEENITIADVVEVVNENFSKNVEQVTKKFYENFRKEHKKYIDFIEGISVVADREWYASLMLNRLMFCYFIQKKGFLDNNLNYLKEKLSYCQQKRGKDKFYVSFYKNFLLALFHQGLGSPDQSEELKKEIGKIPYLNGGLFDVHELEKQYENIDISDKAFENIFYFFDQYNWHLDTRIDASGKDINPDVIGYIFEKYINDRAQMGAYYTKEDITEYIGKNCIIPFLFDETERTLRQAQGTSKAETKFAEVWQVLKESGDTYIYEAVKKGVELPLPGEIEIGLDTSKPNLLERRKEWNKSAPEEFALPTEIWREVVDRRKRYTEIKEKIEKGEINHINDFITYNLNIRQFAQDIIDNHSDPDFIRHFYEALSTITIIDPTCGSGAFLFAAMNILEPLYESCIQRMEIFVEEAKNENNYKHLSEENQKSWKSINLEKSWFRQCLKYVKAPEHPNLKYFVFKNIILRNLYGVDIMKEAVEIAKLRLFLKLVATVDADYRKPNLGLEPLPDIDFNIRSGNTLVGFANEKEISDSFTGKFDFDNDTEKTKEKCEIVARAFQRYKEIQLGSGDNHKDFKNAKDELNNRLAQLNLELSLLLSKTQYGIDITTNQLNPDNPFQSWFRQHLPFHWYAEFYEIIHDKGGFDVVIGNPPYVNFKKIDYNIISSCFKCYDCKDLFALTIERSQNIITVKGRSGFIIPLSGLSTETMKSLKNLIFNLNLNSWNSYYSASDQPSSLFTGVRHRLLITLNEYSPNALIKKRYSTNFLKWFANEREDLFSKFIKYTELTSEIPANSKLSNGIEKSILSKLNTNKTLNNYVVQTGKIVYYHNAPVHWGKVFDFIPYFSVGDNAQQSSHLKELYFDSKQNSEIVICLLNSSLFYWFNWQYSNCRDLSQKDIFRLPLSLDKMSVGVKKNLCSLKNELMTDLKENSKLYQRYSGGVLTEFDSFYPALSKSIIDEIDTVLAEHYGFTEEELDFIINYDIKYRMGKELEEDN